MARNERLTAVAPVRLAAARVLIVGVGGLGSPAADALAAAGVGTLVLADPDHVEASNLNRQHLHHTVDIGRPKVESAAEKLRRRHPALCVETVRQRLDASNLDPWLAGVDFVVDATDSTAAKYAINDSAVRQEVPFSHAGVVGFHGQTLTVQPGRSACLRCLFPEPPAPGEMPTCTEAGILGSVAGVIGALQASEAIRLLQGGEPRFANALFTYDGWNERWRRIRCRREPECRACGTAVVAEAPKRGTGEKV